MRLPDDYGAPQVPAAAVAQANLYLAALERAGREPDLVVECSDDKTIAVLLFGPQGSKRYTSADFDGETGEGFVDASAFGIIGFSPSESYRGDPFVEVTPQNCDDVALRAIEWCAPCA